MNPQAFFEFRSKLLTSSVQAHAEGLKKNDYQTNQYWNLIRGIYTDIDFPVTFKQKYGKNFSDIIDTGWPCLYLISDKMKTALEENNLKGWNFFSIKFFDRDNKQISGYHGLSIIGRCNDINYINCEIIEKKLVPNGPICTFYKGIPIDNWDGGDFFMPKTSYEIFISKKAADVLKKYKLSNLKLLKLEEIETDTDNVPKKNPST